MRRSGAGEFLLCKNRFDKNPSVVYSLFLMVSISKPYLYLNFMNSILMLNLNIIGHPTLTI